MNNLIRSTNMNARHSRHSVLTDAIALSSGTIAVLTGKSTYAEPDAIQESFITFVDSHADHFETWMEAWNAFTAAELN